MTLVVDASVAAKWFVAEVLRPEARALLEGGHLLIAPDLLLVELANLFWKKVRRGELLPAESKKALAAVDGVMQLVPTRALVGSGLELAHQLDHPVYGCLYLALAQRDEATLVTADRSFHDRVKASTLAGSIGWVAERY